MLACYITIAFILFGNLLRHFHPVCPPVLFRKLWTPASTHPAVTTPVTVTWPHSQKSRDTLTVISQPGQAHFRPPHLHNFSWTHQHVELQDSSQRVSNTPITSSDQFHTSQSQARIRFTWPTPANQKLGYVPHDLVVDPIFTCLARVTWEGEEKVSVFVVVSGQVGERVACIRVYGRGYG